MAVKKKYLIVLVGPTAIGKTALSIELAKYFNAEIFSADSRQFFKEMSIGTAKPSLEEMSGIPHHFISHCSIKEEYNVGKYEMDVITSLKTYFIQKNIALLVGGSGLYIDAVCKGIDAIPKDDLIRKKLTEQIEKDGIESLQEELKKLDPEHYATSNIKNPQRLIRALEVCRLTGKTYTSFRTNTTKKRDFDIIKIGLNTEREVVYNRINERVDMMIKCGLENEARNLFTFKDNNALNTVGYKELFNYFEGILTFEEAVESIKKNTRNFAKRQLTWFNKDTTTKWFEPNQLEECKKYISEKVNQTNFV
jgi:tRNA dimethylallyltransferase